jgi:dihydrofolate reductase
MAKVLLDITMSLDGFIAGPNDSPEHPFGLRGAERLHNWFLSGETPNTHNDFFKPSGRSVKVVDEMLTTTGAIITGRHMYDLVNGWGGSHTIRGVPVFVITHNLPERVPQGATLFTFVIEGVASAVEQARAAAGDKDVFIRGGANIAQQSLKAGLIDEIYIHLVPILLGDGVRLFDHLDAEPIELERLQVIEAPDVTHLKFRVIK